MAHVLLGLQRARSQQGWICDRLYIVLLLWHVIAQLDQGDLPGRYSSFELCPPFHIKADHVDITAQEASASLFDGLHTRDLCCPHVFDKAVQVRCSLKLHCSAR